MISVSYESPLKGISKETVGNVRWILINIKWILSYEFWVNGSEIVFEGFSTFEIDDFILFLNKRKDVISFTALVT